MTSLILFFKLQKILKIGLYEHSQVYLSGCFYNRKLFFFYWKSKNCSFISDLEHKINPLDLAEIAIPVSKFMFSKGKEPAYEFLNNIEKTVSKDKVSLRAGFLSKKWNFRRPQRASIPVKSSCVSPIRTATVGSSTSRKSGSVIFPIFRNFHFLNKNPRMVTQISCNYFMKKW